MEVQLDLPESLIRKIRAYSVLTEKGQESFEGVLVELLDKTISNEISTAVRHTEPPRMGALSQRLPEASASYESIAQDVTGISSGLGDEDLSDDTEEENTMSPPVTPGGVTDEMIARDTEVGDPGVESASTAPDTGAPSFGAEDFAQRLDIPSPQVANPEVLPQVSKRAKRPRGKAIVTPYSG